MFSTIHKYNSFSTYLTQVHIISNPQPDSIYIKKKNINFTTPISM